MAGNAQADSRRTVFLGHDFVDEDVQGRVRCVTIASAVMGSLMVLVGIISLASSGFHLRGLLPLLFGLLLPTCGFAGAAYSSPAMMGCFCCTNGVLAILEAVLLCILFVYALQPETEGTGEPEAKNCGENCDPAQELATGVVLAFGTALMKTLALASLFIFGPLLALSGCAWWHSLNLFKRLSVGEQLSAGQATSIAKHFGGGNDSDCE
mmetsp:Transcript_120614/g.237130  ORF Transcript_120614/g.237130 Transcript_120614/m.237130 type:complete len:209 (-) Transcript_120614:32-658(-)